MAFEVATIPFKVVLLASPIVFVFHLSALLHKRTRLAISLGTALVAITLLSMVLYLPWRDTFARHFSNDVYRWYYADIPAERQSSYGDVEVWKRFWERRIPHVIEAALVIGYYGLVIAIATIRRLSRIAGALLVLLGYSILLFVPLLTGLVDWDYDTFLRGIAFDSISMDLVPPFFWVAGDYSIFLYSFFFIFFAVSAVFFRLTQRSAPTVGRNASTLV